MMGTNKVGAFSSPHKKARPMIRQNAKKVKGESTKISTDSVKNGLEPAPPVSRNADQEAMPRALSRIQTKAETAAEPGMVRIQAQTIL